MGEPVAIVVTDDLYHGEDAADLVTVDYQPLPAVVGLTAALDGNTLLFPAAGTNVAAPTAPTPSTTVRSSAATWWSTG